MEVQKLTKYSKDLEIELFKTRKALYEQKEPAFRRTVSDVFDEEEDINMVLSTNSKVKEFGRKEKVMLKEEGKHKEKDIQREKNKYREH